MSVYAFIDVSQKQEFIYRQNQLKNNLLNSYTIKKLTEDMGQHQADTELGPSLNDYLARTEAEFVYSGGGNSIVRFPNREQATQFVNNYSLDVLKTYPELELYISTVDDAEFAADDVEREKKIRKSLIEKADRMKDRRKAKFRRWSYGIEQIDETGRAECEATKQEAHWQEAKAYLYSKWGKLIEQSCFETTDELQKYRTDEQSKSYIGVIAIDGNQMGKMVERTKTFKELGELSSAIEELYFQAVREALRAIPYEEKRSRFVTPVVMSGDDICLIVRAESAVQLAANIVDQIQTISERMKQTNPLLNEVIPAPYLTACAGVAIVKVTYPFYDAVKAAERLCLQAKEQIYKVEEGTSSEEEPASFIDWEIIHGQAQADRYDRFVKHRNEREIFHIRPLRIDQMGAFQNGVYGYYPMIALAKAINEDSEISSSLMEDLKKLTYKGKEEYENYFHTSQTEGPKRLMKLVSRCFEGRSRKDVPIIESEENRSTTYLLNDLLIVLPFLGEKEVHKNDQLADG
ncbi:hypothetical protein SK3146_04721 [Paenibacillus konkukensis]|uniref:Cas10/Cmr2 second palm domain-containing protein n=1 Tax=Paenibacillus konkukensis TaxID=2020716 RepID=A0ABY4RVG1_9BACL|nr:hypothetical protein [Paenibacillus konkukensis]UQZ85432.1 hypothetical protein SK3146_04721 [Paenibacillus konkukensis]